MPRSARKLLRWQDVRIASLIILIGCASSDELPSAPFQDQLLPSLTKTEWTLTELSGQPVSVPAEGQVPSLRFSQDEERVSGFAGCNQFFGAYSVEGDRLHLQSIGMTRKSCSPPSTMQLETRFVDALENVTRATISGNILTLYDGNRAIAKFVAKNGL